MRSPTISSISGWQQATPLVRIPLQNLAMFSYPQSGVP
jgi:hypothetical protein